MSPAITPSFTTLTISSIASASSSSSDVSIDFTSSLQSQAMMPVPSIPQYLVMKILSPVFISCLILFFGCLPMAVDTITGLLTAGVISVCPPITSTSISSAAAAACFIMVSISSSVVPTGSITASIIPTGCTPFEAMSLQDIWIDSLPISLTEAVMGSVDITQIYSPKSISAQSSPIPGLVIISSLLNFMLSNIILFKTSLSSLPVLSIVYHLQKFFFSYNRYIKFFGFFVFGRA